MTFDSALLIKCIHVSREVVVTLHTDDRYKDISPVLAPASTVQFILSEFFFFYLFRKAI